jgi:oxygen-independent coproporphyrinogen-3 oxidase
MGLRLAEGIDGERFALATGRALADCLDGERLRRLIARGFVHRDAGRLAATPRGRKVLNAVIAELAA